MPEINKCFLVFNRIKGVELEAWGWLHPAFLFKARNSFSEVLFPVLDFVRGCALSYLTLCNPGL